MDIRISAKNTTLTPSLEQYIRDKAESFQHLFSNIVRVEVQIEVFKNKQKGNDLHRAEIMVHVPKKVIRADQRASEMHEAFDLAVPKIEKQLEKHKARLRNKDRSFLHRLGDVFSPFSRRKGKDPVESENISADEE